ncbi:alpha/beta fold hydrolase [Leifsonia flava]|uniref:Alpha/beta hydrolase n=1 Tax=Orlajensenia leifsoniae TaxID=2561933 RepID=A0A4Y9QUP8_9MICO|nr:alpha/beta hydrolase [Leifsonia flava]TFV95418.1 alpha/beta hydrolase [Leifsonia flava]
MPATRIVSTTAGPVEIVHALGPRPPVLILPGGQCSAAVDHGQSLYAEAGHEAIAISGPGCGAKRVGALTSAEFIPLAREVCEHLGLAVFGAAVGVSFGGLQAVHTVRDSGLGIRRLVLHSCAASALPFPVTRATTIGGRLAFLPVVQGAVWGLVHRMARSDSGLRRMLAPLSRPPIAESWSQLSAADRTTSRELFRAM